MQNFDLNHSKSSPTIKTFTQVSYITFQICILLARTQLTM